MISASNVRCDGSQCCRGCGPQEQFYGCADVAILAGNQAQLNNRFTLPPYIGNAITTRRTIGANIGAQVEPKPSSPVNGAPNSFIPVSGGSMNGVGAGNNLPSGIVGVPTLSPSCTATKDYSSPAWDEWCVKTCNSGDDCPRDICSDNCRVASACRAKPFFRGKQTDPLAADKWCMERCTSELCPFEYCEESCWSST